MTEPFVEVITEASIQRRVRQLGEQIAEDYAGEVPVMVGILKGCLPFIADLGRAMGSTVEIDFLSLTRFGTDGRVSVALDTATQLEDRHVLVCEDIVDTGLTLAALHRQFEIRSPASVRTVALLDKAPRRIVDVPVDYRGFEVGDEFLLGYGLDWDGLYRNVRSLWAVMDIAVLRDDPTSFAATALARVGGPAKAG